MSESLRERLAAKTRRRVVVPVAISDTTGAAVALEKIERARDRAEAMYGVDDERTKQRTAEALEQRAVYEACFVQVEFQAAPAAEFETLQRAVFPRDRDAEPERVDEAIPELAALCAVEEELRDEKWWIEQLRDQWSYGEKVSLWAELLRLNNQTPEGKLPFD